MDNVFVSDAWSAPATYHRPCCQHCEQRVWVGARNERAPFRIHDAAVGFVDRCLSGLEISPLRIKRLAEFFSGDFFRIFGKFETFFLKIWICTHSERYRSFMAGISEIQTFLATSRLCCHRSHPDMFIFGFLRLSSSHLLLSATYRRIYLYAFFYLVSFATCLISEFTCFYSFSILFVVLISRVVVLLCSRTRYVTT